jgi:hypothetical protein
MDFAAERYWPAAAQIGVFCATAQPAVRPTAGRMRRRVTARRTVEGQASRIRKILNLLSILVPGDRREGESGSR